MDGFVDSNQQLLETEDIIQRAAMETRSDKSYPEVYQAIAQEIQAPGTQFFRQGNTLFIVHHLGSREGFFRALNADVPQNYLNTSIDFVTTCYNIGYDRLITDFDDPKLFQLFDMIARNPPNPEMGYTGEQMTDGSYRVTIALGPERGGEI
jgi:hypothetical protein